MAAMYINCVTVWMGSGKTAAKMHVLFLTNLSIRPSAFANAKSAERIVMTFDDIHFLNFLIPSNCGQNLAIVADTFHAFCCPPNITS